MNPIILQILVLVGAAVGAGYGLLIWFKLASLVVILFKTRVEKGYRKRVDELFAENERKGEAIDYAINLSTITEDQGQTICLIADGELKLCDRCGLPKKTDDLTYVEWYGNLCEPCAEGAE
jgi:hypothetical protein